MPAGKECVEVLAPAKVNLYLAVTGLQADGFHSLVSLVAPLDFGDKLRVSVAEGTAKDVFSCSDEALPMGDENLVVRALSAYREHRRVPALEVFLEKKIPVGAGLGGGSSDAVAMLQALQKVVDEPLPRETLFDIAASLGSDCPLFLDGKPVVMRGRGEMLAPVSEGFVNKISAAEFLLFKPSAPVSTPWAYRKMKDAAGEHYTDHLQAEQELAVCLSAERIESMSMRNDFEGVVFDKFPIFGVLFPKLEQMGYAPRMSGSGSACFMPVPEGDTGARARAVIEELLGSEGMLASCGVLGG